MMDGDHVCVVVVPVFDRSIEIDRAGARIIMAEGISSRTPPRALARLRYQPAALYAKKEDGDLPHTRLSLTSGQQADVIIRSDDPGQIAILQPRSAFWKHRRRSKEHTRIPPTCVKIVMHACGLRACKRSPDPVAEGADRRSRTRRPMSRPPSWHSP